MQNDLQTKIFAWFARNSKTITSVFHFSYYTGVALLLVLSYLETRAEYFDSIYSLGRNLGQAALVLLGLVALPGILGRFKIEIRITRVITLFRRQLGIAVFLLAFSHYTLLRLVPTVVGIFKLEIPYSTLFENLGALALFILFVMFLTSNNASRVKLGKRWSTLHRLIYVAIWVIVFHVGLQQISIWTYIIFSVGVLEILSWIFYLATGGLNKTPTSATSGSNSGTSYNQRQNSANVSQPL